MKSAPYFKNLNYKCYLFILLFLIKPPSSLAQNKVINFNFENENLKLVLKKLIKDHELTLIFPEEVNQTIITTKCHNCSEDNALDSILYNTKYTWSKKGSQYTVYELVFENNYELSGQIFDKKTGESIAFANVYIPEIKIGDVTEYDGSFSLPSINLHNFELIISYIGYKTEIIQINFLKDDYTSLDVYLNPDIIVSKKIHIIGSNLKFMEQSETPGQITFSPKYISSLPNLGEVDIFRSLQLLPGFQLGLGGTADLYIKGSKPEQNLILLDGMPIYQSNHMFGFINGINSNGIKDVQVYSSGIPAKFGNLTSNVVELTSKRGNNLKTHGEYQRNFMSNSFSFETPLLSRGSLIFNVRNSNKANYRSKLHDEIYDYKTGNDQFNLIQQSIDTLTNQKIIYKPSAFFSDFLSRISFLLTPKHTIALTNIYSVDSTKEERSFYGFRSILGNDSTEINIKTHQENNGSSLNISSNWNYKLNSQIVLSKSEILNLNNANQSNNQADSILMNPSRSSDSSNFVNVSKKLHITHKGFKNNKLNLGIEQSAFNTYILEKKQDGNNSNQLTYENKTALNSFYFQNKLKVKNLTIHAGFRTEYFSDKKKYFKSPRFSFIYNFKSNLSYEASIGRYHQFIHNLPKINSNRENDFYWVSSSESIPEISSLNFSQDINFIRTNYTLRLGTYNRSLNKFFQFNGSLDQEISDKTILKNTLIYEGSGSSMGLEFLIRKINGKITGWTSYHINKTKLNFPSFNQGLSFPSDHDKRHELKTVLITKLKSYNLTANWVFSSGRVFTNLENMSVDPGYKIIIDQNENENRLPYTHHLDISISREYNLDPIVIQTGFSVYNLYNNRNISHKRYNPYNSYLTMTDVETFGITPTGFIKIRF